MAVPQLLSGMTTRGRRTRLGVISVAAALTLSACGGGAEEDSSADAPDIAADQELADMVPSGIRDSGTLVIGVNAEYPPGEFLEKDGQTVTGFNVDLFDAVAAKLDLETEWTPAPFGSIITGVESGKFDVGISSVTINAERMKQVNMVSYYTAGTQWFTRTGNPQDVEPDNACGARIAVQKATIQVKDITERSEKCEADGEPAIVIQQFQEQTQATESVVSGKNDAALADTPVAGYAIKQTGEQLETLGEQYEAAPYGAVLNKEKDELAEAVAGAYSALIDDGSYASILEDWGVQEGSLTDPAVNPDSEG